MKNCSYVIRAGNGTLTPRAGGAQTLPGGGRSGALERPRRKCPMWQAVWSAGIATWPSCRLQAIALPGPDAGDQ